MQRLFDMNWSLLLNSLAVSGAATLFSVSAGFFAGLWLVALAPAWRKRLLAAAMIALVLPPFLVTNCWLHFFGLTGVWRSWLPLNIYSPGGTIWILTLLTWPIPLLGAVSAWQRLEPAQLESDPALEGAALIRWLLWPMARVSLGQAALLTFVLALNNFAVPAILQVKVFPAEICVKFSTNFSFAGALMLSWPLVLAPIVLLLLLHRAEIQWPDEDKPMAARAIRRQLGPRWFWCCALIGVALLVLSVALPLTQILAVGRTWAELPQVLRTGSGVLWNSFVFSAAVASVCIAIALAVRPDGATASSRFRWSSLLWLPFLMPGVLLGIGLVFIFNRPVFDLFYHGAGIVLIAWSLRYLAFGWNGVALALQGVDRDLTDAARLSGASGWALLRYVQWPQIAPRVGAIWYVTYLLCLWDVETIVLIYPPGGETLALRIFNLLHYGHNAQVNALCLLLLALALAPLGALTFWRWLSGKRTMVPRATCALAIGCLLAGCSRNTTDSPLLSSQLFSRVEIIGSRGTAPGQFNKPRSVALDTNDNLFVVDMTGRVQKFSPQGVFLGLWQMPETDKGKPKGMCCDAQGHIVVLEPHYSRVNHFTSSGQLVRQWGAHGTNAGQLALPRAVAVNPRGTIFVSEYGLTERVQSFSADGTQLLRVIGREGASDGQFNRAEGLGLDTAGRLYVADSCNHRIQVFSPDGKWLRSYGSAGSGRGQLSYPYDVRTDAMGYQFVCEFGNSRIQIFDAQDRPVEILGGAGSAPGRFSNPWSIALDSLGNLYVADANNHRVQRFIRRIDGKISAR